MQHTPDDITKNFSDSPTDKILGDSPLSIRAQHIAKHLRASPCFEIRGRVKRVIGTAIYCALPQAAIGDFVRIARRYKDQPLIAQVIGFSEDGVIASPFGSIYGIYNGATCEVLSGSLAISIGDHLLGHVLDHLGQPIDEAASIANTACPAYGQSSRQNSTASRSDHITQRSLHSDPISPIKRRPISEVFHTGYRAIDSLLTIGIGQRLAVFAEPGVGKTSLLSSIACNCNSTIKVIALVGERGREVGEFITALSENSNNTSRKITPNNLCNNTRNNSSNSFADPTTNAHKQNHLISPSPLPNDTILVISTSDQSASERISAALTATTIAEHFRDLGHNVLLEIDSLTRLCRAYRELGLASGELPVKKGYPPSLYAKLPHLIERAGTSPNGSITAFYSALLSSDIDEDPIVEEIKSLCDGHIILSKALAETGHFPAIDIPASLSRLQRKLVTPQQIEQATLLRQTLELIRETKELTSLGIAPTISQRSVLASQLHVTSFLKQSSHEYSCNNQTWESLAILCSNLGTTPGSAKAQS